MKRTLISLGLIAFTSGLYAQNLNVFSGPSVNSPVIATTTDSTITKDMIKNQKGPWKFIQFSNTQKGWILTTKENKKEKHRKNNYSSLQEQYSERLQDIKTNFANEYNALSETFIDHYNMLEDKYSDQLINLNKQIKKLTKGPSYHPSQNQTNFYKSVSFHKDADGKNVDVETKWLGSDGKLHDKKKVIPASQFKYQ